MLARDGQEPPLSVDIFYIEINNISILCIHIGAGLSKPVFIKGKDVWSGKSCFKRTGAATLPMTESEIRQYLATKTYYDESPIIDRDISFLYLIW